METVKTDTMPAKFTGKIQLRQELLFWITAGVLLLLFLDSPGFSEVESFRAETLREMVLTGSWFRPVFNWENIFDHSFISYWLAAPFVKISGFTEAAFRLPSVLAALAALYGIRMAGEGIFDRKVAYLAGWMLLSCAGFLLWGRCGTADMAGMAAAVCSTGWYFKSEDKKGFLSWMIFYLICFAGVFCSGLSALIVPAAVVLPLSIRKGGGKRGSWKNAAAFLLAFAFFLLVSHFPLLLPEISGNTTLRVPGILSFSFKNRVWEIVPQLQKIDWQQSWAENVWYLPRFLLPWSPLLLVGIAGLLKNWHALSEKVKISLIGTAVGIMVSPLTGMDNALLAVLPLCLLLGCGGITGCGDIRRNDLLISVGYYAMLVLSSAAVCSIVVYPLWHKLTDIVLPLAVVVYLAAAGCAAWFILFLDHGKNNILTVTTGLPHRLGATVLAGTILTGCCISVLQPRVHAEFGCDKKFFRKIQGLALQELPDYATDRIVFYRTRVAGGFLFYNRLISPVSSVGSIRELLSKSSAAQVIFVVRNDKSLLDEFKNECRRLDVEVKSILLIPARSLCCGGKVHYSVFSARIPQKEKGSVSSKESVK